MKIDLTRSAFWVFQWGPVGCCVQQYGTFNEALVNSLRERDALRGLRNDFRISIRIVNNRGFVVSTIQFGDCCDNFNEVEVVEVPAEYQHTGARKRLKINLDAYG